MKTDLPDEYRPQDRRADGGFATQSLFIETRERLAEVEQGQKTLMKSVNRIETKVEDVRDTVEEVDDESLSQARFEREYVGTINQWDKYQTVVAWLMAVIIFIAALVQILNFAGVNVFA